MSQVDCPRRAGLSDRDSRGAPMVRVTSDNPRKCLGFRVHRAVATLLLCSLGATLSGGCLAFEDYPVLSDLPPPKNQPIRFVSAANPAWTQGTLPVGTSFACRADFAANFEDLDLSDSTRSIWIVDNNTSLALAGQEVPAGEAGRRVSAPPGVSTVLAGLSDSNYHMVEVRATDSQYDSTSDPSGKVIWTPKPVSVTLPDGTVISYPGTEASCVWFVKVAACP